MFKLFNTLTRSIEDFRAIKKGQVRMYTCGPTVYDFAHIGNYRAYICSDILRRWLEYSGYEVRQVMNLTDIDDKTIRDSQKHNMSLKDFTAKYITAFFEDIDALNIERANEYPKATDYIDEMVRLIKTLMEKGFAYRGEDGSIYFSVRKFPDYGKLSRVKISELEQGASGRVKSDEYEREQANDFALWKAWTPEDGNVFWETEIGRGRPGWHIECSAMSMRLLGGHFDIHAGGIDLIFPHHENEIAQSEGASGGKFADYWFHNEYLMVNGKKMSKKLGNFFTLRDLLEKGFSPKAIRYLLMSAHYKVPLNFTETALQGAEETIARLKEFISKLKEANGSHTDISSHLEACKKQFGASMDDDLNISSALASVFDFMREINKLMADGTLSAENAKEILGFMKKLDKVLGLLEFAEEKIPDEIMALVNKRQEARKNRDFAMSDKLRDEIRKKGWQVDDTKDGVKVKKI